MKDLTAQQIADNWILWLKALASGEYRKTYGILHLQENGQERHCCLGVAQICLGLDRNHDSDLVDARLVGLLGLFSENGKAMGGMCITSVNDSTYRDDDGFGNMHKYLLENVEKFTSPEAAAIVREKLQPAQ